MYIHVHIHVCSSLSYNDEHVYMYLSGLFVIINVTIVCHYYYCTDSYSMLTSLSVHVDSKSSHVLGIITMIIKANYANSIIITIIIINDK